MLLAALGLSQASISPVPTKTYPHTAVLDGGNNVHLYWEFDSTTITFEVSYRKDLLNYIFNENE